MQINNNLPNILLSFTHPDVIWNLYDLYVQAAVFYTLKSELWPQLYKTSKIFVNNILNFIHSSHNHMA